MMAGPIETESPREPAGPDRASRRRLLGLIGSVGLLAVLGPRGGLAAEDTISVQDALKGARSGRLTLVDVRSPEEWRKTGLPEGAEAVTIHGPEGLPGFVAAIRERLGAQQDQPIALICATGVRSTAASRALRAAGYTRVLNVREGLFGNQADGPGWLRKGLPTEPCQSC
ncbi:MAG: rhodanese-like domain-containing protein [Kiloniellales bacterium]|nr:rhodanese-like domain-containing protein [Kiloniellales bacterium]